VPPDVFRPRLRLDLPSARPGEFPRWARPRVCALGGAPMRLAYDNLRAAVRRTLVRAERALSLRVAALAAHYLFEPCFCRPATGHDKGGVEGRGKTARGQHLVPTPDGPDLATINVALLARFDGRLIAVVRNCRTRSANAGALSSRPCARWPHPLRRHAPRSSPCRAARWSGSKARPTPCPRRGPCSVPAHRSRS